MEFRQCPNCSRILACFKILVEFEQRCRISTSVEILMELRQNFFCWAFYCLFSNRILTTIFSKIYIEVCIINSPPPSRTRRPRVLYCVLAYQVARAVFYLRGSCKLRMGEDEGEGVGEGEGEGGV